MKKVAVLGSGTVGEVLANGLLQHGYAVMRGSRDVAKLAKWKEGAKGEASVGSFEDAAKYGELLILAVKGSAAEQVVETIASAIAGKTVLDATNPIADAAPTKGVLAFFTGPNDSLMERLQKRAPAAHFVKAFSCVGNANMVNPDFGGTKPTMFICGDDAGAKKATTELLTQFGWETEDMGAVEAARAIEPLCMLWCIPGMLRNQWTHAFHMLRR